MNSDLSKIRREARTGIIGAGWDQPEFPKRGLSRQPNVDH